MLWLSSRKRCQRGKKQLLTRQCGPFRSVGMDMSNRLAWTKNGKLSTTSIKSSPKPFLACHQTRSSSYASLDKKLSKKFAFSTKKFLYTENRKAPLGSSAATTKASTEPCG